ncbi:ATP-binding cassette domain-containing protein [Endozoicomonas sp. G2_1]|uniref:ATP-binding cassette domain-containing protein n=1 Tax=Endozoicomonas sp. G2_1 TaxID=2821091 RepID=UPI001ADCCD06|nr:ATP-binding cassette domain-containing protein [Endozoicomonas sp. G2_1]MBO9490127.1 ATP-binding cassette domain-containing protein [Endozoicomonas sp. G2_1]
MLSMQCQLDFGSNDKNWPAKAFKLDLDCEIPLTITGVFGHSGSGKSSLLKWLAGLEQQGIASKSELNIIERASSDDEQRRQRLTDLKTEQRPFAWQQQQALLFPHLTVSENLALIDKHSVTSRTRPYSVDQVIEWTGIGPLLSQPVTSLSGGEAQRVSFARTLITGKRIILLDEPFTALDWSTRVAMLALIRQLHQVYQLAFIIVSHSLAELSYCCQHIIHLVQGQLVQQGSSEQVLPKLSETSTEQTFSLLDFVEPSDTHGQQYGLMACGLKGCEQKLWLTQQSYTNAGSRVRVAANKVSLARAQQSQSSMLNCLSGEIVAIDSMAVQKSDQQLRQHKSTQHQSNQSVLVTVLIGQQLLRAEISSYSCQQLSLAKGQKVYAQFKAL